MKAQRKETRLLGADRTVRQLRTALRKLRIKYEAFVVMHINETDSWDQEWSEIGHTGSLDCKCGHCG